MKAQYANRMIQLVISKGNKIPEWIDRRYEEAYRTLRASIHAAD